MISEQEVVDFCDMIRNTELDFKPSFFEITFVMAIRHFINQECDYVVLETGMGGRLDATNVVHPLVSVITNIGLDHQQYLGNTRIDIAKEKAGIIKEQTPLVIGIKQEEVYSIFKEISSKKEAPIHISQERYTDSKLPKYQLENVNTAITALEELHVECSEKLIQKALTNLYKNTGYQKRMEIIQENPRIILDASHNKEGLEKTMQAVHRMSKGEVYCILGSTKEREINQSFMDLFKSSKLYITTFSNERSKCINEWNNIHSMFHTSFEIHEDVNELYAQLKGKLRLDDTLIVTGSFFLISDLNL